MAGGSLLESMQILKKHVFAHLNTNNQGKAGVQDYIALLAIVINVLAIWNTQVDSLSSKTSTLHESFFFVDHTDFWTRNRTASKRSIYFKKLFTLSPREMVRSTVLVDKLWHSRTTTRLFFLQGV